MASRRSLAKLLSAAGILSLAAAATLGQPARGPSGRQPFPGSGRFMVRPMSAPRSSRSARGRAHQSPKEPPAVRFADVTLSHFSSLDWKPGKTAKASGPNTTLEATDPKEKRQTRLQAETMMAWADPKKANQVERVQADTNVRFASTRPLEHGAQTVRGTGRRATYEKAKGVLTVEGPVHFSGQQPTADGKSTQSIDGTANRVVYDENKRLLTFIGDVKGVVVVPQVMEGQQPFSGDQVQVDMSDEPYSLTFTNPSEGGSVTFHPKPAEKNDKGQKGK